MFLYQCNSIIFLFSRVAVVSKSFEGQTDKTEEWYGTQYKQEAISEETIKVNHCHSALIKSHAILGVCF